MITFQEVPNEVAMSFLITGCSLKCSHCHSASAWNWEIGTKLTPEVLSKLIEPYRNLITTVLFLWGEWEEENLLELIKTVKEAWFKTALYTGLNKEQISPRLWNGLNYIKVGPYKKETGGLSSPTTNQKMYSLNKWRAKDITYYFNNKE